MQIVVLHKAGAEISRVLICCFEVVFWAASCAAGTQLGIYLSWSAEILVGIFEAFRGFFASSPWDNCVRLLCPLTLAGGGKTGSRLFLTAVFSSCFSFCCVTGASFLAFFSLCLRFFLFRNRIRLWGKLDLSPITGTEYNSVC